MAESVKSIIETRIQTLYPDATLLVNDQSAQHQSHLEGSEGSGTHFDVLIRSQTAMDLSRVERERRVHTILADLYTERGLHALSLKFEAPR
jgi:BolA family transcriptional regulator, general stress-responsive regulator